MKCQLQLLLISISTILNYIINQNEPSWLLVLLLLLLLVLVLVLLKVIVLQLLLATVISFKN